MSVVAYNSALASVERAKGTLLEINNFEIQRVASEEESRRGLPLEEIQIVTRE